ncbi:hypothetical protein P7K49_024450 [Saguinus oedipus]|uniref:Uncharacterized protein n=1 Tax=Saguinus oedipus TaxID=9490 RepID=A0ABQ9UPI4_SAGOE|nr:hypothetical protein P7K49_024450 [Saguinus oedipus]
MDPEERGWEYVAQDKGPVDGDGKLQEHRSSQEWIPTKASTRDNSSIVWLGLHYKGSDLAGKSKYKTSQAPIYVQVLSLSNGTDELLQVE